MAKTKDKPKRQAPKQRKRDRSTAKTAASPADDMHKEVQRVSAKAAAVRVLRKEGGPLKADEIAKRVLAMRGVRLEGKTPAATIIAKLVIENKKPDGLFVRVDKGTYALREQSGEAAKDEETKEVAA